MEKIAPADRAREYLKASPPELLVRRIVERATEDQPKGETGEIFAKVDEALSNPSVRAELHQKCEEALSEIFAAEDLEILTRFHVESEARGLWGKLEKYGSRVVPYMQSLIEKSL